MTFINIASCKSSTPSPRKVETYGRLLTGKGLCAPLVAKSLLSKSNTGSMAVFRDALISLKIVTAIASIGPNIASACSTETSGVRSMTCALAKAVVRFLSLYPASATRHLMSFSMIRSCFSSSTLRSLHSLVAHQTSLETHHVSSSNAARIHRPIRDTRFLTSLRFYGSA